VASGDSGGGSAPVAAALSPNGLAGRYARVIIAAVLLLVVMAGVRVAAPAVAGHGPLRHHALALGIAGEVALAALEIALLVRARRSPDAVPQAVLMRKGLQLAAGILMVAIAGLALANLVGSKHPGKIMKALAGTTSSKHARPLKITHFTVTPFPFGYLVYSLLALVVLAAIVVCVLLLRRRRPGLDSGFLDDADAEEAQELRQAVESGRVALHAVDDARAAIIACYVAMEASLARAGTARAATDTPDELLGRAAASGLLRGPAAGRLTVLFYEARFSTHGLPETVRDDARHALDAILAELAGHAAAAPAEGAGLMPGVAGR
jgi:Domain of unknown function (DUF4129)